MRNNIQSGFFYRAKVFEQDGGYHLFVDNRNSMIGKIHIPKAHIPKDTHTSNTSMYVHGQKKHHKHCHNGMDDLLQQHP